MIVPLWNWILGLIVLIVLIILMIVGIWYDHYYVTHDQVEQAPSLRNRLRDRFRDRIDCQGDVDSETIIIE